MIISPPSFSFKGDRNKAISLKAQALQLYDFTVRSARLGGVTSVGRTFTLSDGSQIIINSAKQSNYNNQVGKVTIISPYIPSEPNKIGGEIYMESGLVTYSLTGCGQPESTNRPWNFRVLDATGPQGLFTQDSFSFSGLLQGLESISFGCKKDTQVEEIEVVGCDESLPPFTIIGGGYCTNSHIKKKNNYTKVRPSVFSGLTRRYVQALYGSDNYDMEVDPSFGSIPHIKVPRYISSSTESLWKQEKALAESEGRTYTEPSRFEIIYASYPAYQFIYRNSTYDYFFISKVDAKLYVYPMVFSEAGDTILSRLRSGDHTESSEHLESYALSSAKPDTLNLLYTHSISGIIDTGRALAFTWSGDSTGSNHTLVTHGEITDEKMFVAREWSLELSIDRVSEESAYLLSYNNKYYNLSAQVSQIGSDLKWNPRLDKIWGHNYLSGKQMWFSGSWFTNGSTQSESGCPLYSYYTPSNEKKVIKITGSHSVQGASSGNSPDSYACGPGASLKSINTFSQSAGSIGSKGIQGLIGSIYPSRDSEIKEGISSDPILAARAWALDGNNNDCGNYSGQSWNSLPFVLPPAYPCVDTPTFQYGLAYAAPFGTFCASIAIAYCTEIEYVRTFNGGAYWKSNVNTTYTKLTGESKSSTIFMSISFTDCMSVLYGLIKNRSASEEIITTYSPFIAASIVGYQPVMESGCGHDVLWLGDAIQVYLCKWTDLASTIISTITTTNLNINTYEVAVDVQGKTISVESGNDIPLWIQGLLDTSSFDLWKFLQPTLTGSSDLHGNYRLDIVRNDFLTLRDGFVGEDIGAMGWQ